MKILITGGAGQIGRRLAQLLPDLGEVVAPTRDSLDLTDVGAMRETVRSERPDVIVNAAAYTEVDRAETEPALAHAVNADAPRVLAEEARSLGALFVHYSSDYVFDGAKHGAYTEDDAPNPLNEYGRSKLAGDEAIEGVGGAYLVLRTSWVYDADAKNFVTAILRLARERSVLRIVDDQIGAATWACSLAQVTRELLRDPARVRAAPGLYNATAEGQASRYTLAQRIVASGGFDPAPRLERAKSDDFPAPARRPLNSVLDTSKLRRVFGVRLEPWETQLDRCLAQLHPRSQ